LTVVTTSGARSEADLPFAGLHQLMRRWLAQLDALPPVQRDAISAAFGMSNATAPEPFVIAMATLNVLGEAVAHGPLLLAVEDAHWLDRPTADVLAFTARRIASDPIVLIATRDICVPSLFAFAIVSVAILLQVVLTEPADRDLKQRCSGPTHAAAGEGQQSP
jgi:hypothetical protein